MALGIPTNQPTNPNRRTSDENCDSRRLLARKSRARAMESTDQSFAGATCGLFDWFCRRSGLVDGRKPHSVGWVRKESEGCRTTESNRCVSVLFGKLMMHDEAQVWQVNFGSLHMEKPRVWTHSHGHIRISYGFVLIWMLWKTLPTV